MAACFMRSPLECDNKGLAVCPKTRPAANERRSFVTLKCRNKGGSYMTVEPQSIVGSNKTTLSPLQLLKTSPGNRYTKEKSSMMVIGLNYHTAPLAIREKLSISEERLREAISELCLLNHIEEAAVLSTCNRMEIYVVALSQRRGAKEVTEWISQASGVPFSEICQHRFLLYNKDATNHLFEVSSGIYSVVLEEGQILSQVKQVVKSAEGVTGFGRKISGLFKHAITAGKRVRTEASLATGSVSVSSAAVDLALTKLPELSYANVRVLVVGAGKMGKIVIKHLVSKGCKHMVVVNRTEATVISIRKEISGAEITYKPLSELLSCAAEAEVIFTCTASESPLLLKEQVAEFPYVNNEIKGEGKRLFIDISVPRNVEPCVSKLENVRVYNVDDLKEVVKANKEIRLHKANEAREIIFEEVGKFENWKDTLETVPTIKKFRAYGERVRETEVKKCFSKMGENLTKKQKEVIIDLSMGIMNQFMHGPTQHLRCDGSENRCRSEILESMHSLNRFYELDTEMSVFEEKIRTKMEQMNI